MEMKIDLRLLGNSSASFHVLDVRSDGKSSW